MNLQSEKVEYLIVDTSAFIRNVPLQDFGEKIITEQSVINEITNKRQLRRLVVLPYDLAIKDVFPENVKFVTEFAKKTGDYTSLSATDIKVIALTYQLEKEQVGTDHLKESPSVVKTVPAVKSEPLAHPNAVIGFYAPGADDEDSSEDENEATEKKKESDKVLKEITTTSEEYRETSPGNGENSSEEESKDDTEDNAEYLDAKSEQNVPEDLASKFERLQCNVEDFKLEDGAENIDDILAPVEQNSGSEADGEGTEGSEEEEEEDEDNDDDDDGWITVNNVAKAKKEMDSDFVAEGPAKVACMTTDFAMQNVLMQIGLKVAALDGRVIKQMRTFIFRCYACFKTTSIMTKVFCPRCGMRTLKKVAVSVDDQGNEQIHINFRRPLSARGKKFSLPTFKGGKHASNPILYEDQPMPQQRLSRKARMKTDALHEDYTAGYSPFASRDLTSRSAVLGIATEQTKFKYWMKRNPNESKKKRR